MPRRPDSSPLPACAACGRPIEPRRSHRAGQPVVYCSAACRRRRVSPADRRLEELILAQLGARAPGASICPSEVARAFAPPAAETDPAWREQMEPVRRAGRRLAQAGRIEFLQRGRRVDPATARGPIRLRLAPGGAPEARTCHRPAGRFDPTRC